MKCKWILRGRLVRGSGTAAQFTQLDWVQRQCRDKLGFAPFPGTLNLIIGSDCRSVLAEMKAADAIELIPDENEGCAGKVFPLSIEGIRGAIVFPDPRVNIHDENVVEVIAPVGLRARLGLTDGQVITLLVD